MPRTRLIHLVWHTKSAKHIEWIRPMLEDVSRALRGSENIMMELDIYVTRTSGWPHGNAIAQDPVYEGASVPTTAPLQRQTNSTQKVHEPLFHFVRWSSGRADLGQVVVDDRARSDGPIHVSGKADQNEKALTTSLRSILAHTRRPYGDQRQYNHQTVDARTSPHHIRRRDTCTIENKVKML